MEKATGTLLRGTRRVPRENGPETLFQHGLTKKVSARAQQVAGVPKLADREKSFGFSKAPIALLARRGTMRPVY